MVVAKTLQVLVLLPNGKVGHRWRHGDCSSINRNELNRASLDFFNATSPVTYAQDAGRLEVMGDAA